MIRILKSSDTAAIDALLAHDAARDPRVMRAARRIVDDVRENGDEAVRAYARKFDGWRGALEVTPDEILEGASRVPAAVRRARAMAARHLERVAERQLPRPFTVRPAEGVSIQQRVTPLPRAGCYVPAGRYPLPSSLIMTAVPARVAGVREIIAVCPRPDYVVMAAAVEAGITRMFRIGGAHAIAALAYGTETVPAVSRIAGPGNAYVAAAKSLVAPDCPIDLQAGPSEIAVISRNGNPDWIAADLIAQAEHDPDARAVLFTASRGLAGKVARAVERRLRTMRDTGSPAATAVARHGAIVIARNAGEAIALVNRMAPEHAVCDDDDMASALTTAGTIFVGPWSAQAAGDYITGSNHVLPTGGAARFRGGLSAADFVKTTSVQRISAPGFRRVAPAAIALADAEGLTAHAGSMRARLEVTP